MTDAYAKYRRSQIAELADWHPDFDMRDVSISNADFLAGSPKLGDKIARNPSNHDDRWLVAADYFAANFEPVTVSEKGEADDLVRECRAIICELCNTFTCPKPNATLERIDAYLFRRRG